MKVAIIGGGMAGLSATYYLQQLGQGAIDYVLIESSSQFGGKVSTIRESNFVVEGGPDSFHALKTAAVDLCRALNLDEELIGTNTEARKVFVWSRGKLRRMPEGVMLIIPTKITPFLKSGLISWPGKLRMGLDLFIPRRKDDSDVSLADFVRRRLGKEALDRIAGPMVAGIYVADADHMSLKSTFPRFLEMEKKYGSLLRGIITQKLETARSKKKEKDSLNTPGKAPNSNFLTLRGGLQRLPEALVEKLNPRSLLLNRKVETIRREGTTYDLTLDDGSHIKADAVVFATPTYVTSDIVKGLDSKLSEKLKTIRYVSTATVSLGYRRREVEHSLSGFGFVVPRSEKRKIIACAWSSTKFNWRAPEGYVLVRAFVGGASAEELAEQDEASLLQMVREEMRDSLGINATPILNKVFRWRKGNPQYDVGHEERVAEIDRLTTQHEGLYMAGAAFRGVGVPDCIADGKRVAQLIAEKAKTLVK
ncbi:MAG: protoporphyrinogen oxidase [Chloroflexi bacterium]|uniref:Coproporphyrinogen III oxidase n=1 Tax=Candidatus Chlorohelix allophototropha TaxID=3003348 RepID=A0A8T7M6N8_9CHLR|nr:protoporphyrinogen oxidase [Chloroflexota bacterium]WJW69553.1 protoporphyrinogen oxidase [Chloroflexota bacterium L227-S17]